jgi:hypothetical protein
MGQTWISLRGNVYAVRECRYTPIDVSKEAVIGANVDKTPLIWACRHQNAGQNGDINIAKGSLENVSQFKHRGTTTN